MAGGRCAPINGALCVRARFIGRGGGRQEEEGGGKSMWLYCLALAVAAVIALPTTDRPRPSPSPTFEFRNGTPHCFAHKFRIASQRRRLQAFSSPAVRACAWSRHEVEYILQPMQNV